MSSAVPLTFPLCRMAFLWMGLLGMFLPGCGGGDSGTPAPTVAMNISPANILSGQTATLTWSSTNASTCAASDAWSGSRPTSGSLVLSPPATGTYNYTLSCASSSSSAATASAALSVTPLLAITTASLANGVVGTFYNQSIQATGGVAPFDWIVSSGALPHGLVLSTSTSDSVTISGTPDTAGQAVVFTIEVTDSAHTAATQSYTVSILLQADALSLSPASLDFGGELVGSASSPLTETLTNHSTYALAFGSIAITGPNAAEFNQTTSCAGSLAAGASCAVNVTFTPGQVGSRSAALTITDDMAGSPQSLSLTGMGLTSGPNVTLSPSGVDFGTQLVGLTSTARLVKLTNYGTATVSIVQVAATQSFAETDNCVPSVASGAGCTINVTFTPGAAGKATGTLSFYDDAPGSPQGVSLSGTGSTSRYVLNGSCYAGCDGTAYRPLDCPVGQPAREPTPTSNRCGPPGNRATIDLGTYCSVSSPASRDGHCEVRFIQ